ncbi:MGDG synthase family glycosyltransferase [Clostridium sp.]|uniref:MGDG synthase family glycosyltransferase n=1 Tax=Clostridium sp. TaxID=1506 RepID=UPI003F3397DF
MKKILILTASTGEGHNQAALAIANSFENNNYEVLVHDFLQNNSNVLGKIFTSGYSLSASVFPNLYGFLYNITDNNLTNKFLYFLFLLTKKRLSKIIYEFNPDVILTTHPISVSIIANLSTIPKIVIVTDFKAHFTYINENIDVYITASEYTKNDLAIKGISKSKIFPLGIPVKNEFSSFNPLVYSTKDGEYFNILLMGGSMGLKNISYVLKELLNNTHKLRITVVCGNNENLKDDLLKRYGTSIKDKKLHILGFSKDVDSLMDYSDLIISKPGGLTVSESINKKLPLLIPFAIPGQETQNTDFLTSHGYALYVDNLLELNLVIDNLITCPNELNEIRNKYSNLSSTYSKDGIVSIANFLIKNN